MKIFSNFINEKLKLNKDSHIIKNDDILNQIFNTPQDFVDMLNDFNDNFNFEKHTIELKHDNILTDKPFTAIKINSHFEILVQDWPQYNCKIYLQGIISEPYKNILTMSFMTFQVNNKKYEFTSELMTDTHFLYYKFGQTNFKEWITDVCKKRGYGFDVVRKVFNIKKGSS